MSFRTSLIAATAAVALASAAADGSAAERPEIGAVGAAAQTIKGTPPQADPRVLETGVRVVRDERIVTSESGIGEFLFDDQSSLTVAPNSDITLDKYVYDAGADSGEVTFTLTKGAMRFIGGRITKSRNAVVKTSTGTMGIRGGMGYVEQQADGSVLVVNLGALFLELKGSKNGLTISRNGAYAIMSPSGDVLFKGDASAELLNRIFGKFRPQRRLRSIRIASGGVRTRDGSQTFNEFGIIDRQPVATDGSDNRNGRLGEDGRRLTETSNEVIDTVTTNPPTIVVDPPAVVDPEKPREMKRRFKKVRVRKRVTKIRQPEGPPLVSRTVTRRVFEFPTRRRGGERGEGGGYDRIERHRPNREVAMRPRPEQEREVRRRPKLEVESRRRANRDGPARVRLGEGRIEGEGRGRRTVKTRTTTRAVETRRGVKTKTVRTRVVKTRMETPEGIRTRTVKRKVVNVETVRPNSVKNKTVRVRTVRNRVKTPEVTDTKVRKVKVVRTKVTKTRSTPE